VGLVRGGFVAIGGVVACALVAIGGVVVWALIMIDGVGSPGVVARGVHCHWWGGGSVWKLG
jgi:hypothetical protein